MSENQIIRIAQQADKQADPGTHKWAEVFSALVSKQAYLDGVNSGIEAEREACAKLCETKTRYNAMHANTEFAAAIRARGVR